MGEYQEVQIFEGLKATKYVIGKETPTGHSHIFYLRDHLPIATTESAVGDEVGGWHAHSIEEGPDNTLICVPALGHSHTKLVIEEDGDYKTRTLFSS